jgi:hypothetical protein
MPAEERGKGRRMGREKLQALKEMGQKHKQDFTCCLPGINDS